MRLVLASAFALLACAAACTTFGSEPADAGDAATSSGTSGTSGSSGTGTDPPDDVDAGVPKPGANIPCGSSTCSGGQSCCVTTAPVCKTGSCSGTVVTCAKQSDCDKGSVCCAHVDPRTDKRVSCVQAPLCERTFYTQVCETDADCKGKICQPLVGAGGVKSCAL